MSFQFMVENNYFLVQALLFLGRFGFTFLKNLVNIKECRMDLLIKVILKKHFLSKNFDVKVELTT